MAKGLLIAFSALVCLWMISGARAAGIDIKDIKQHGLEDGSYAVEFVLSKAVAKEDVAVDFQRNFIQLSLKGVSAFPARTEKLNNSAMEKVFTYQYQPDMARARMLLKGQASAIQKQSSWEIDNQIVRIIVKGGTASVATTKKDTVKSRSAAPTEDSVDLEEEKVRNEILNGATASATSAASPAAATAASARPVDSESTPIFTGAASGRGALAAKEKESPAAKIFASLLLVVGVIGAGALAYRRFASGKGLNFQRQGRMIETISTQSLGPKRSIALVKVLDQHMVIGMSGDGMTLLANLGANVNMDRYTDDFGLAATGASFTDTLKGAMTGGNSSKNNDTASSIVPKTSGSNDAGFRASLKKRLEGFKPL